MRFLKFLSAGLFVLTSFAALFFFLWMINKKNSEIEVKNYRIYQDSVRLVEKEKQVAELNRAVTGLNGAYQSLQNVFSSLNKKFLVLERSNDSLKSRIEQLTASVNKIQKEKETILAKVERTEEYSPDKYNLNSPAIATVAESLEKSEGKKKNLQKNLTQQRKAESAVPLLKVSNLSVTTYDTTVVANGGVLNVRNLVCQFAVLKDLNCPKGKRELFVQIVKPDGRVYNYLKNSGLFYANGRKEAYSTKIEFDYKHEDKSFTFPFANEKTFPKGTYKVLVYEFDNIIGTSVFTVN